MHLSDDDPCTFSMYIKLLYVSCQNDTPHGCRAYSVDERASSNAENGWLCMQFDTAVVSSTQQAVCLGR